MPSHAIAVVLSGSGFLDGAEITEAISVLVHLSRRGASISAFAPNAPQADVVNHATGKSAGSAQTRNMMVEAARLTRGSIQPLDALDPAAFDAVVFPGGFGVAKSLCTFAAGGPQGGSSCVVLPDVARVIKGFHAAKKPMAFCCVAPVLPARVLGTRSAGPGVTVTLGRDQGVADRVAEMGSKHVAKSVHEAFTDRDHRIVTTPAYMEDARPHEVFDGIGQMIDQLFAILPAR